MTLRDGMRPVELTLAVALFAFSPASLLAQPGTNLRTLIVGGGPNRMMNAVGIESNVRYVDHLLPPGTPRRVLFADGKADSATVVYVEPGDKKETPRFRMPNLPQIDGPSTESEVRAELKALASEKKQAATPTLLYFTGHGDPGKHRDFDNNWFGLWGDQRLTVKDLAAEIDQFPKETPLTLVMVQCFSGGFGNVLFKDADPKGKFEDRPIAAFFASIAEWPAAGCTAEVNEADYHDFTTYFFAALTGVGRMGNPVTGADYNHDSKVGMDEAFAYTLIHDESIDTPVDTSDVFLRRFVHTADVVTFAQSFSRVLHWATPAQRAALEALAAELKLSGDRSPLEAFDIFTGKGPRKFGRDEIWDAKVLRFARLVKSVVLAHDLNESHDKKLKQEYADLVKRESENPLRP